MTWKGLAPSCSNAFTDALGLRSCEGTLVPRYNVCACRESHERSFAGAKFDFAAISVQGVQVRVLITRLLPGALSEFDVGIRNQMNSSRLDCGENLIARLKIEIVLERRGDQRREREAAIQIDAQQKSLGTDRANSRRYQIAFEERRGSARQRDMLASDADSNVSRRDGSLDGELSVTDGNQRNLVFATDNLA